MAGGDNVGAVIGRPRLEGIPKTLTRAGAGDTEWANARATLSEVSPSTPEPGR